MQSPTATVRARNVSRRAGVSGRHLHRRGRHQRGNGPRVSVRPDHAELELTYNYGVDRYELGSAYGHVAIGVLWLSLMYVRSFKPAQPDPHHAA